MRVVPGPRDRDTSTIFWSRLDMDARRNWNAAPRDPARADPTGSRSGAAPSTRLIAWRARRHYILMVATQHAVNMLKSNLELFSK